MSKETEKALECLEILYNSAKLDVDRIESSKIVTYAEEIEHNEGIKPFYETIKQALTQKSKKELAFDIVKKHKLLNYVLKNPKCASMYHLQENEIGLLRGVL